MGRHDSTDCPDTRSSSTPTPTTTNPPTRTPARRAGVLTAAMSLALLTAAGAAMAVPQTTTGALASAADGATTSQPAESSVGLVALSTREVTARVARSSRSATRGPLPSTDRMPEVDDAEPAAAEAAVAEPAPPAEEPEPEVVGSRYAEAPLNVRKTPEADADVITVLDVADRVKITDVSEDGFRQIIYKDKVRWVTAEYLAKSKPKAESGGLSSAPCANGSGVEGGLGANAIAAHRAICARWSQVTAYGGYRGGSSNHSSGRALDVMISGSTGMEIANWARANASRLGITEVIHQQRIWTTQRAGDGWRGMSDRGSATANHYDHVHLSFR
ncbi:MAG TPA: SH3 domain-containing protein [Motilibacterales bacterium]|nr:SH3 domain-containing protein [Motilibacterales bacterium]